MEKYNEIQSKKMDLNNRKMTNHPPSTGYLPIYEPETSTIKDTFLGLFKYLKPIKKVSLLWPGPSQWRIYYHRMWDQLSTTCSNYYSSPMGNSQLQSTTTNYRQ